MLKPDGLQPNSALLESGLLLVDIWIEIKEERIAKNETILF